MPSTSASMRIWSTVSARERRKLPSSAFCRASRSASLSSVIGCSRAQVEVRKLHLSRMPRWPPQLHPILHHVRGRYHLLGNRADRLVLGGMLALVVENHPNRTIADF